VLVAASRAAPKPDGKPGKAGAIHARYEKSQIFPDSLSNSGLAVRRYRESRITAFGWSSLLTQGWRTR
jgi:hypothetical protein